MRVIYLGWILFLPFILIGQKTPTLLFKHLDYKSGLSDPNILCLYSDTHGFLWIGTYNGLNRFDGRSCITYQENTPDSLNLKGNFVAKILPGRDNDIYFGTQKGLSRYSINTGGFKYLPNSAVKYYYAYPFFIDSKNKIWGNIGGSLNVTDSTFQPLTDKTNGRTYIGSFFKDSPEWFVTNASHKGLFIHYTYNYTIKETKEYFRTGFPLTVSDVYVANDTLLWAATNKGLVKLNPHSGEYRLFPTRVSLSCLFPYKDWLLLGSNGEGMLIFDLKTQSTIAQYKHEQNNANSLSGNHISEILVDKNDNLFIGVLGKGLDYTNFKQVIFNHILNKEEARNLGVDNSINFIHQRKNGEIWCATNSNGILVYDANFEKLKKHHLKGIGISKIFEVAETDMLIELKDFSHLRYDNKTFKNIKLKDLTSGITQTIKDQGKTLLVTPHGAAYLENDNQLNWVESLNTSLDWRNISYISPINKDELLIQTFYTSLFLVKKQNDDFKVIKEITRTPYNIHGSQKIGTSIYLATTSGLRVFDTKAYTLSETPLMTAYCSGIAIDKKGKLWISTNNGLFSLNHLNNDVKHYTEADGLQGAIFNLNTLTKLKNGMIASGGGNGINVFNPDEVKDSKEAVRAYITKININDHPYTESNPIFLKTLEVDYKSNTLSFQITPLDFKNAQTRNITYQMEGYDDEPVTSMGFAEVRYAKIPPGKYTFKALIEGNPTPTILTIKVARPFWKTAWFVILCSLSLIGLTILATWLFGRWIKNNQLEKLRIMLSSQEEERKRIAIDLHDDLGGRLSSLKLFMQATAKGISHEHKNTFKETTNLLDEAISELRNILFNLSPKTLEENGLEAAIADLAENINRITGLTIETNIETHKVSIGRPVQYALYRICQELINNTLKHSGANLVHISLIYREDGLVLLYEDNGKGFEIDEVKEGYGLTNLKTHAQAIFSDLIIDSSLGKGTAVTLIIPKHVITYEPPQKPKL